MPPAAVELKKSVHVHGNVWEDAGKPAAKP